MPSKRVRTLIRAPLSPTTEVPALTVNTTDIPEEPMPDDDYIYDSDDDLTLERNQTPYTSSSSTSAGNTAPIGSANSVTEVRAPVVLGNEVENTTLISSANQVQNMAPIGSANSVTNTPSNQMETDILQMGNVIPPRL